MEYKTTYKYDYDRNTWGDFDHFLEKLYHDSCMNYLKNKGYTVSDRECSAVLKKVGEYVEAVEEYMQGLVGLGYLEKSEVRGAVEKLKKGMKTVGVLPHELQKYLSCTDVLGNVMINPNLRDGENLSSYGRTLLYVGYEVGHFFHEHFAHDVDAYVRLLSDKYGIKFVTSNTCNSIVDGFRLLSDAVCQDVAEEVAYFSCYAERPVIKVYNGELLNDELFVTNFDSKGEIQGLATRFAQTISFTGLSPFDKEEQALKKMSIASFKDGFVEKVVGEYQKRNLDEALFSELYCMGRIEDVIMSRYMSKRYEDTREVSGQMLLDFKKNAKFCKVYNNMHTKNYN